MVLENGWMLFRQVLNIIYNNVGFHMELEHLSPVTSAQDLYDQQIFTQLLTNKYSVVCTSSECLSVIRRPLSNAPKGIFSQIHWISFICPSGKEAIVNPPKNLACNRMNRLSVALKWANQISVLPGEQVVKTA